MSKMTHKIVVLFVMILAVPLPGLAEVVEWSVSSGGNGHRYEAVLVPEGITWTEANNLVNSAGGGWHLATVTSPEENDFIYSLFEGNPDYWVVVGGTTATGPILGAHWVGPGNGSYAWVTGEPFDYANWGPTAPNGDGDVLAYFGYYQPAGTSTWNDIPDDYYWWIHAYIRENPQPLEEQFSSYIGIFGDADATLCARDFPLYQTTDIHVVATLDMTAIDCITAAEFLIDGVPDTNGMAIVTPAWDSPLIIGDALGNTGFSIAFSAPQSGPIVHLGTIGVFVINAAWPGDNSRWCIAPTVDSGQIALVDCSYATILAGGWCFTANCSGAGCDCTVAVDDVSWSSLKALY